MINRSKFDLAFIRIYFRKCLNLKVSQVNIQMNKKLMINQILKAVTKVLYCQKTSRFTQTL